MRLTSFFLGLKFAFAISAGGCGDSSTGAGGAGAGPSAGGEGGSGGTPLTGDPIKIMNWNLHNFFDTEEEAGGEDDSISQSEYTEKLNAVVATIESLAPDVIVFCEVENQGILDDINAALDNAYPESHISEGNDPRSIDIAALSKIPFTNVVSHLGETFVVEGTAAPEFEFTRDLLEYHFEVGSQKVVLLGVHFKAKGPPDNPDKRLAEAQRTRAVADELTAADPSLGVLILGDFNDLPDSPPLDAVTGSDPVYVDAASFVPEGDRWSFDFQGSLELIDHQIGNPVMMDRLDEASVHIEHEGDVDTASDHHPLIATYYLD
jgi:predicted extracellular nuclease